MLITSVKKVNDKCEYSPSNDVYITRLYTSRFSWNQAMDFNQVFSYQIDRSITENKVQIKRLLRVLG